MRCWLPCTKRVNGDVLYHCGLSLDLSGWRHVIFQIAVQILLTQETSPVVTTRQFHVQIALVVQMVISEKTGAMVIASGTENNVC